MFKEVLSAEAIPVIESLAPNLETFYLAGGSGLALQQIIWEKIVFGVKIFKNKDVWPINYVKSGG